MGTVWLLETTTAWRAGRVQRIEGLGGEAGATFASLVKFQFDSHSLYFCWEKAWVVFFKSKKKKKTANKVVGAHVLLCSDLLLRPWRLYINRWINVLAFDKQVENLKAYISVYWFLYLPQKCWSMNKDRIWCQRFKKIHAWMWMLGVEDRTSVMCRWVAHMKSGSAVDVFCTGMFQCTTNFVHWLLFLEQIVLFHK